MIYKIKRCIEQKLDAGFRKFIIYLYGDIGMKVKQILNQAYGITELCIIDEHLSRYNENIQKPDILEKLDYSEVAIIISTVKPGVYEEIRHICNGFVAKRQIGVLIQDNAQNDIQYTVRGKYSTGPLCNHVLVESVGAFCSFALGTDVVRNHPNQYVSTHPFLYYSGGGTI